MEETLFVYGTLMDRKLQRSLLKRKIEQSADVLMGYRRAKIKIGTKTYPLAIASPKHFIHGSMLEITTKELKELDHYEGKRYKRLKVKLRRNQKAWVYVEYKWVRIVSTMRGAANKKRPALSRQASFEDQNSIHKRR